jgi:hypothetical protein
VEIERWFGLSFLARFYRTLCTRGYTLPDPKISYPLEFIQHLESHNVFPLFSIFLIYLFIYLFDVTPNVSFDDISNVWKCSCGYIFKKFKFFLLKFNIIYIFWIVLIC